MPFLEFHNSLMGYEVRNKRNNAVINRWELYIRNYTFQKIKDKFKLVERLR